MKKLTNGNKLYEQGDLVWINFSPTEGHEQRGRRPALVFSIADTQKIDGVMLVLPITSTKNYRSLSIKITTPDVYGKVLVDQVKTIDPSSEERDVEYIGQCPNDVFDAVDDLFDQLIHK